MELPALSPATKNVLRSRTIWFNTFSILLVVSGYVPIKWAAFLLPIANIGLRLATTQGLTIFTD